MSMVIVQVLGLCISASLFFIGYADRRWVRNLSFGMCLMTGVQSFLLGQSGVLVMNLVNLTYYSMLMLEDRLKFVQTTVYRVTSMGVAVVAAAVTQYAILGRGVWSPGTLALLGGATGLAMALMESFALLKAVTLLNVAAWVSYYIAVGSYTNLIGNAFVLIGVIVSIWQRARRTAEPPTITASGLTVPVDTGSLRRVLHSKQ